MDDDCLNEIDLLNFDEIIDPKYLNLNEIPRGLFHHPGASRQLFSTYRSHGEQNFSFIF